MSRGGKVFIKPGEDQSTSLRVLVPHGRGQGEHSERDERPRKVSRGEKRMDCSVTSSTTSRPQSRVSKYGCDVGERHPSASGSSSARGSKMKRKGMSGTELEPEKLLAELKRHETHLSAALLRFSGEPAKYQQVSQIWLVYPLTLIA